MFAFSCLLFTAPCCYAGLFVYPVANFLVDCKTVLCGLWGCKNWPAPFPGRMLYKATKPGLVSFWYLSMHSTVLLFIRAPFYVSLVFVAMCSVFLLFWFSYQYLPSDWLERLLWGSLTVRGLSPESPGRRVRMIFLVYCIASFFYCVLVYLPIRDIFSYCYGTI